MESKRPISHILAGLLIALVLILFRMILYFAGITEGGIYAWIPIIFIVGGLILFIYLYGAALNNQVTFGNLFAYGFKTTAFLTLIIIAFTVIFTLTFPDVKEKGFEMAREKMSEKGDLTSDEIDQRLEIARKYFWVFAIGFVLLIYAVVGAVGSVIGAAITPKKKINPMDQLNR